jgi:hypothetical protein
MHIYDNRISTVLLDSIHEFKITESITANAPEVLRSVHIPCIVTYSFLSLFSFRSYFSCVPPSFKFLIICE